MPVPPAGSLTKCHILDLNRLQRTAAATNRADFVSVADLEDSYGNKKGGICVRRGPVAEMC